MSGVVTRLSRRVWTIVWTPGLRQKTRYLFTRHLLLTNTAITVLLSGCGDLMQQYYHHLKDNSVSWNPERSRNICLSGLAIGPACHFWYLYLDKVLPGRTLGVIMRKVLADQLIASPVCVLSFLVIVGYSEGASRSQVKHDLQHKGPPLLKAEWIIWPPAQMLNFAFLPPRYRVLYDNTISLGFDNYYSYVKYRRESSSCDEGSSVDCWADPDQLDEYYITEDSFVDTRDTARKPIDFVPHYGNICGSYYSNS